MTAPSKPPSSFMQLLCVMVSSLVIELSADVECLLFLLLLLCSTFFVASRAFRFRFMQRVRVIFADAPGYCWFPIPSGHRVHSCFLLMPPGFLRAFLLNIIYMIKSEHSVWWIYKVCFTGWSFSRTCEHCTSTTRLAQDYITYPLSTARALQCRDRTGTSRHVDM